MTIVVKGIGFANLIWSEVVDYVQGNHAIVAGATYQDSGNQVSLAGRNTNTVNNLKAVDLTGLSKIGACVWAYNQLSSSTGLQGPVYDKDTSNYVITVKAYDDSGALNSCGTIKGDAGTLDALELGASSIITTIVSKLNVDSAVTACETADDSSVSCFNTQNFYYTAWSLLYANAANSSSSSSSSSDNWYDDAKVRGWITAASYYSYLTGATKSNTGSSLPNYESSGSEMTSKITITPESGPSNYQTVISQFVGSVTTQKTVYDNYVSTMMPSPPTSAVNITGPASTIAKAIMSGYGKTFGESWSDGPISLTALGIAGHVNGPGLFGGQPYFAFDHMVVMTNTVVTKLTGCSTAVCKDGGSFDKAGCTLLERRGGKESCTGILKLLGAGKTICKALGGTETKYPDTCDPDYSRKNGFLGMLYKQQQGYAFDPLDEMRSLGVVMIQAAVNYWKTTLDVMYQKTTYMAWATYGVRIAINLPLSLATAALYGFAPALAVIPQGIQTMLNSMLDVIVSLIREALQVYVPFGTALATAFFSMGVVLGIYLPFMPYLLYIFGAIGWLIGVAESLVAAPLVAMGVTHPEGHDLLGKAEQSLMLLLGIFIRPATMLIGFIFAINLATVAVSLLNIGFMNVFIDFISGSSSDPLVSTINLVGTMLVYTYVMMSVLDQAYSLIYQIPDRILRWIGGPADSPGAGAAQAAREVKQQTQSAGSQAGQGAGGAMRAPNIGGDSSAGSLSNTEGISKSAENKYNQKNAPSTGAGGGSSSGEK
jgi:hypothetical protein